MDVVDSATRSRMMSGIRSKDTKPEMTVRRFLHARGFRYRLHARDLPGSPDLVLPKYRVAILVHGCFWHRHSACRFATTPASNAERWRLKFQTNIDRDIRKLTSLQAAGWRVIVVWECELKRDPVSRLEQLALEISPASRPERCEQSNSSMETGDFVENK
jgi:DNA mismatch endonuclease (patch repair protein)